MTPSQLVEQVGPGVRVGGRQLIETRKSGAVIGLCSAEQLSVPPVDLSLTEARPRHEFHHRFDDAGVVFTFLEHPIQLYRITSDAEGVSIADVAPGMKLSEVADLFPEIPLPGKSGSECSFRWADVTVIADCADQAESKVQRVFRTFNNLPSGCVKTFSGMYE